MLDAVAAPRQTIVSSAPADGPFAEPLQSAVFFGTGKQAANLALCIRKQLEPSLHQASLDIIGIERREAALDAFRHRVNKLFPGSGHVFAANTDRFVRIARPPTIGFIASPPQAHEAGLRWMMEHGVERIVVEKPIASSHADLESIGDVLRSQPERVCVQEQYLYSRLYDELLRVVRDPTAYIAERCIRVSGPLSVTGTVTRFYKKRLRDLGDQRHVENICLLELPHILTLLHSAFGKQSVASLDVDDLLYRSKIYPGYKKASIVFNDRASRRHQVDLSNVDPCRRTMSIQLSGGYNVELRFPGRLRNEGTFFESRVTITRGRSLLYAQCYADDHLTTAVRHYLRWHGLLGTYDRCYEPSRLVIELAGR
jgi:predicted dehydrogenase